MKKILCIVFLTAFVAAGGVSHAQEQTVRGRVTSAEDGTAVPGVNVLAKGTSIGTVTDADGNYTLAVSDGTLVFSFIGLKTVEVAIQGRSTVDVRMDAEATQLSEVVVTALGI